MYEETKTNLTSKEIDKISNAQGSVLCFNLLGLDEYGRREAIYHQIAFVPNKFGLIEKFYGCKEDFDIKEDEEYELLFDKEEHFSHYYYLLNINNIDVLISLNNNNKIKVFFLLLYCFIQLFKLSIYKLRVGNIN